ncbi:response regulator transcription factor [Wenyingzhuangia sp. 2_MG-2023]|uniref:response regulator n=1 Tax=Wenyingzhuangia sp. 2_MG-2023 TaxID=3062639 RepID=UPI0026E3E5B1|nr:response regulator transcription factor [Wenyingzhuangia sp. 2_MG-2023]MDO6739274.1 response regulator transcription factor [Wenyingzhuangia sp. 2_MG-2023]MDO6803443.1 response regulator transcription factor [Wenyingzhuangia sp. 1_MG-2023]
MKVKKIMLVDDHEIFRHGVVQLIDNEVDMEVVAQASNGYEAIVKYDQFQPDIILMDISMPQYSGLDASEELFRKNNEVKILFLSLYDRDDYILKAVNMGAHGYILKDESNKDFLKAIRKVSEGKLYFSGDTSNIIINSFRNQSKEGGSVSAVKVEKSFRLSKRETQILEQIAVGLNNKDLSDMFGLSIRTVESHRLNIMRKLRVKNIEQAILVAKSEKLIQVQE